MIFVRHLKLVAYWTLLFCLMWGKVTSHFSIISFKFLKIISTACFFNVYQNKGPLLTPQLQQQRSTQRPSRGYQTLKSKLNLFQLKLQPLTLLYTYTREVSPLYGMTYILMRDWMFPSGNRPTKIKMIEI